MNDSRGDSFYWIIPHFMNRDYPPEKRVGFHPTFSRQGITDASIVLRFWLNENVGECEGL